MAVMLPSKLAVDVPIAFGPDELHDSSCSTTGKGTNMHLAITLALVVFVGAVTGAGATTQPTKSSEQTDPISYTAAWPHSTILSIAQGIAGCCQRNKHLPRTSAGPTQLRSSDGSDQL